MKPAYTESGGGLSGAGEKIVVYQIDMCSGLMRFRGRLTQPDLDELLNNENIILGQPYVMVSVSDAIGIQHASPLQWNQEQLVFEPGTEQKRGTKDIQVPHLFITTAAGEDRFFL